MIKLAKKAGFKYFAESPSPDFFSSMFCDGGLLTLSRYPILFSEFRPFPQGIGPDFIVLKGILYTKIKVDQGILHLFSTHTQASYTHEIKYFLLHVEQFICFRKFVEEMLKKNSYKSQDLVLFVGDFNVDPRENVQHDIQSMKKHCPALLRYSNLTSKETFHEYEMLLNVLSDDFRDDIEELYFAQNGEHPTTFGDYYVDENNHKQPKENALTHADYLCSDKRLDFIFKFVPRSICFGNDQTNEKMSSDSKFIIQEKSTIIEKFLVDQQKFTQLSDHYGVKVTVKYSGHESTRSNDSTSLSASPEADKFHILEKS